MGNSSSDIKAKSAEYQLDALDSHGRDDSIASKHPLLVETANDKPEAEPPVFGLPTELARLIFEECGSDILFRLTLTHTCRRWRQIAVNDACLWTKIYIKTLAREPNSRLDHFVSFLGMQLDRTADLLLDVEWLAEIGERFFVSTLELIRQKAPFSRWRTLRVRISGRSPQSSPWCPTVDAFTNLKSLVWHGTDSTIIRVIDDTITSHLDVLVLPNWPEAVHAKMITYFRRSFTHISTLILISLPPTQDTSFLPANIVNVQLNRGREHLFPHVQTYTLMGCTFVRSNTINLGNMTTLIVNGPLTISCQVFLPALRQLTLKILCMDADGRIEAPSLDILYFKHTPGVDTDAWKFTQMDSSLLSPGYLLSPNTSIMADSYLPITTLLSVLVRSPKVTHVTLRFDDWGGAHAVLEKLLGFRTGSDLRYGENQNLCPRLSELRLDFGWEFSEPSASTKWLINRLKARRGAGIMPSLSIYASWKGKEAKVLLMND